MVVGRVNQLYPMSEVRQVPKAREVNLEETVYQVVADREVTEVPMVSQAEMVCLA